MLTFRHLWACPSPLGITDVRDFRASPFLLCGLLCNSLGVTLGAAEMGIWLVRANGKKGAASVFSSVSPLF